MTRKLLDGFFAKVRTHEDDSGLWVAASDFANEMGGSTTTAVLVRQAKPQQVRRLKTMTASGPQTLAYLHESFVYSRILRSRRPEMEVYADELIEALAANTRADDLLGRMGIRTAKVEAS